jgi:hypothetical protein
MRAFGDWLKHLGFSGTVLSVGLIVATSSSAWSASSAPVEPISSPPNPETENSQAMRDRTTVNTPRDTSPPTPLLEEEESMEELGQPYPSSIGATVVEPTVALPVVTAQAVSEVQSETKELFNDYPLTGVAPPETSPVSRSASDLLVAEPSNSEQSREAIATDLTSSENNIIAQETPPNQTETAPKPEATPQPAAEPLDLSPEIIQNSPVLQRWIKKVPNVLEEIRRDPSFRTRVRLGYSQFPSTDDASGFNVGVEDVFLGRTGLTVSGDYQASFNGDRKAGGADLRYYVLPLGGYINIAPQVGYRYVETGNFSTDGVNVGARLMLALSRTGAADISITQSFVSPGSNEEVGITSLSVGYAITRNIRLATDIQKQNSREEKDSRVGIVLEWMP